MNLGHLETQEEFPVNSNARFISCVYLRKMGIIKNDSVNHIKLMASKAITEYNRLKEEMGKQAAGIRSEFEKQLEAAVSTLEILKEIEGEKALHNPQFAHHLDHLQLGGQTETDKKRVSKADLNSALMEAIGSGDVTHAEIKAHPAYVKVYTDIGKKPANCFNKLDGLVKAGTLTKTGEGKKATYSIVVKKK